MTLFPQANQRVEEFKAQLKELKIKLKTAEKRAIIAEKTVKIFTKEMDKREGHDHILRSRECLIFQFINMKCTQCQINIINKEFFILDYLLKEKEKYKFICDDLDSTFSELTGY